MRRKYRISPTGYSVGAWQEFSAGDDGRRGRSGPNVFARWGQRVIGRLAAPINTSSDFLVDALRQFQVSSEQQNRGRLISRWRKVENSKWNYLLWNQQLSCMQNQESVALPDAELARLNCYLPCFRINVHSHRYELRPQLCPSRPGILEFEVNIPLRVVPILRPMKIDH